MSTKLIDLTLYTPPTVSAFLNINTTITRYLLIVGITASLKSAPIQLLIRMNKTNKDED